ncbi:MAG: 16S rRNA (adenine(1518)-N(6)/adenine(1519)-N(6))-dimethyltransferase RsmA [Chloroflexota bacterium]
MGEPHYASRLPTSRKGWLHLLQQRGLRPRKALGQHFLLDQHIVQRIVQVADVAPGDVVIEIGPGLGILTEALLDAGAEVFAIELDKGLAAHLRATFGEVNRFHLIEGDALKIDPASLVPAERDYAVVANLPYSIASAVLMHLLEAEKPPRRLTIMVQREVAERLAAKPPAMTILGIAAQFFTTPRIAFVVPPDAFYPPPNVDSAVVVLDVRPCLPLPPEERARFFRIVNAGFRHKRKQIANSLADEFRVPKEAVVQWLTAAGIDPSRRAETLSVEEWVKLTQHAPEWLKT